MSGAAFDPADPSILWVVMNKGRLFKMHKVDGVYAAFPEWDGGLPLRFADGGGELDAEGVTIGPDGAAYITSERDNGRAKDTSYNKVARFDVSAVTRDHDRARRDRRVGRQRLRVDRHEPRPRRHHLRARRVPGRVRLEGRRRRLRGRRPRHSRACS